MSQAAIPIGREPAAAPEGGGSPSASAVTSIELGKRDSRGEEIRRVHFKRTTYAIYESGGRVRVQYADETEKATSQITSVAPLIPLRDRLHYLIDSSTLPGCYLEQMAEAFRLGLEGQPDVAQSTLTAALGDAQEWMARKGRIAYLRYAGMTAILLSVAVVTVALLAFSREAQAPGTPAASAVQLLMFSTAAGAMGALFSIALGIRARTVVVDADWKTNAYDGMIRVGIGAIAGAVLSLFLTSGVVSEIKAGDVTLTGSEPIWQMAVMVGFAAGFLERLVPDLLDRNGRTNGHISQGAGKPGESARGK